MGEDRLSREVHVHVAESARSEGGATRAAEQKYERTRKLHPHVDPQTNSGLRRSLPRFAAVPEGFRLTVGPPMPVRNRLDTTSSMGNNVQLAFDALPDQYAMLAEGENPVLGRYDVQIGNDNFNDRDEDPIICRSEFEMAEKIARQLKELIPIRMGGDPEEDPHYAMFAAAYLTDSALFRRWGLKGYDFTIGDAPAHPRLEPHLVTRIFGDGVYDAIEANGFQVNPKKLPSNEEIVRVLLEHTHAFFLQVGHSERTTEYWQEIFPPERVVIMPRTQLLPQVQAAIIGLTEGVLDLQSVERFLREQGKLGRTDARAVTDAVSGIPIGVQTTLENFSCLPKKDDIFAEKTDVWPIGHPKAKAKAEPGGKAKTGNKGRVAWL